MKSPETPAQYFRNHKRAHTKALKMLGHPNPYKDCTCPELKLNGKPTGSRNLSPGCPVHGSDTASSDGICPHTEEPCIDIGGYCTKGDCLAIK